ncbi:hypothetical protein Golomagni_07353, partial [Golovinomyces magnicellulatus]
MVDIWRKFSSAPATVPTDQVVSAGLFDDTLLTRTTFVDSTLVFDSVLDVDLLEKSLCELVERGGWQKLGARLRFNKSTGRLDFHIPSQFSPDRPSVRFHRVSHHMNRASHPIASKLPDTHQQFGVLVDPTEFHDLLFLPDMPMDLDDYVLTDEPQLSVVVVSFDDATLVSTRSTHIVCDAPGFAEFLHAWSLKVSGRCENIPRPLGFEQDPLAELGLRPTEAHKLAPFKLSTVAFLAHCCRVVFHWVFDQSQYRMICVPGSFLRDLHVESLQQLKENGEEKPYLTDGDVLCAWWTKANLTHCSTSSTKLIQIINALGWRPTLAASMLPNGKPYIGNALGFASVLMPACDIISQPAAFLSERIRQSITESRSREQIEAHAALWRKSKLMLQPLFGSAGMDIITCSNISQARPFDIDFAGAVTS